MPALPKRRAGDPGFPVVGVGASAGGLEAFTELIKNLRPDAGMAYVLIQHLRHDAESLLTDILGRASSMPVLEASDGLQIEPDHIYVMPAAADLEILQGGSSLSPEPPFLSGICPSIVSLLLLPPISTREPSGSFSPEPAPTGRPALRR